MSNINYQVEGRNGYYSVDEYKGESCQRQFEAFKTKKLANSVASELNYLANQINELKLSVLDTY